MNSAKNVGRKRLGRLPIVGGASNTNHDTKRPCQIESRAHSAVEKVPRLASPELGNVDLSFSASFACDLESDLDLMSALDKMENAFKRADQQNNSKSSENLTTKSSISKHKENKSNTSSLQTSSKLKDAMVYKTPNQCIEGQRCSGKFSAHKENERVSGAKRTQRKRSVILSPACPQDGSLWTSPVSMSTPQNPQPAKSRRSSLNSSKRNAGKSLSHNGKGAKLVGKSGQQNEAMILKTPAQVENTRVTRSSSKRSNQRDSRQKPVHSGIDGNHETPVRGNVSGKNNRSDFFKSLFIDNTSFEDISTLEGECRKQNIAVDNKKNNKNNEVNVNGQETQSKKFTEKSVVAKTAEKVHKRATTNINQVARKDKSDERIPAVNLTDRSKVVSKSVEIETQDGGKENAEQRPGNAVTDEPAVIADDTVVPVARTKEDGGSVKIQPGATADQLALSSWGLPEPVLKQYHRRGITHMFQWQAECLLQGNVLGGGNLVYSAPTSAGKTMVAELLVLKRVLETRKKAIIILPFVSVTREKMFYLQELYQDAGIRVSGFMGSYAPAGGFSNVDVAVCTIEKGNGIINRCLEENRLDQLGILVVDELHLIGDPFRGYLLELLLTKIAYMVKKSQQTAKQDVAAISIQVVGMSATLPNLDLLAHWVDADLYRTDYRPVPLTECVKIGTALYDSNMSLIRDIDTTYQVKGDSDHVVPLCIETIRGGHSILIFCPTKNWCEKLSETVARELYNLLRNPAVAVASTTGFTKASDLLVIPLDQSALRDVVEQLKRTPVGVDQVLGRTVPFGVAYHHAGLTFDERDIVEGAFRQGIVKVLIATSTLSSGVNLPARRVLVRTPVFHGQLIDFLTYKQMIGRAGRKGVDTAGESILLCKPSEKAKAAKLLGGALPPVQSTLIRDKGEELSSSMKRAILEVVVSGVAMAPGDVASYASCTLLAASLPADSGQTDQLIQQCIRFLQENEFVTSQTVTDAKGVQTERFVPTQLGAAVLASSLSPDEGLVVFSELQRARRCFVLENELHIIYQVTPIYAQGIGDSIDWYQYFCIWESLSASMKKVSELAGVKESFLARAVQGRVPTKTVAQLQLLRIHKRFYTALALHDLVQEVPLPEVAKKYNCNKGQLQSLQQSAATFAGMVTVFCARLGWSNLELILSQFQNRLTFGVQRELCDLVRISSLNGQRARVMFNGGYQTVAALASAHPADVEALLKNSAPFQSMKRQDKESDWDVQERCKARCIFLTGRKGMTEYEAAVTIIAEAKSMIQDELGGLGIQWRSGETGAKSDPSTQLRTPVLTSPLAGGSGRLKSVLAKRRSRSASRVRTSPGDIGNSRPSVSCVVSPPPPEKQSEHAETEVPTIQKPADKVDVDAGLDSQTKADSPKAESSVHSLHVDIENVAVETKIVKPPKIPEAGAVKKSYMKTDNFDCNGGRLSDVNKQAESDHAQMAKYEVNTDDVPNRKKLNNAVRLTGVNCINSSKDVKTKEPQIAPKPHNTVRELVREATSTVKESLDSENISVNKNIKDSVETAARGSSGSRTSSKVQRVEKVSRQGHGHQDGDANADTKGRTETLQKKTENMSDQSRGSLEVVHEKQIHSSIRKVDKSVKPSKMENAIKYTENRVDIVADDFVSENVPKTISTSLSGSKYHVIEEDFADSFLIDTQVVLEIDKGPCKASSNTNLPDKSIENEEYDCNFIDTEENMHQPNNQGQSSEVGVENGEVCAGNTTSQKTLAENVIVKGTESQDGKCPPATLNEEHEVIECDDEILFSDESNIDLDNSGPRNTSVVAQKSDVSLESDCNELDMNIADRSGVDMFEKSEELIAASNYEHFGMSGESRTTILADNSYQDLHIPYQSGQERCFQGADKDHPRVEHVRSVVVNNIGANSESILGQFSSQKPKKSTDYSKLHEDLAVAMEMGESFTNTFSEPGAGRDNMEAASDSDRAKTTDVTKETDDNIGDSLTFSMMEQALEEPQSSDSNLQNDNSDTDKHEVKSKKSERIAVKSKQNERIELESKQSCDIVDVLSDKQNVHDANEINGNQSVNKRKEKSNNNQINCRTDVSVFHNDPISTSVMNCFNDDTFVTPVKAPNKRLRETPVTRKQKVQKTDWHTILSDNAGNVKSDKRKLRSGRRSSSVETAGISPGRLNTSTGSDYVPPTPPEDESMIGLTQEQDGTPKRTPHCSLKSATAFSPRLKAAASARKCKQKLHEDGKCKEANHAENGKNNSRSKKKGKKSNVENNKKIADDNTKASETDKKKPGQDVEREEKDDNVADFGEDDVEQGDGDDEDKLSPSFIDPDESGLPLTQASFTIIDVCADKRLFKTFILEWRTKTRYAVSLASERKQQQQTAGGIGANFRKDYSPSKAAAAIGGIPLDTEGHVIVGVAVSWDNRDAYYVSFTYDDPQGDPDDSLAPPQSDPDISISIRMKAVRSVLQQAVCKGDAITMVMFDVKAHYRAFVEGCGFAPKGQFEDPKIACWMLDPGAKEKNLHRMVTNLLPTEVHMLHGIGGGIGVSSLGMTPQNPGSGRYRATTECVLVRHLGEYFRRCLEKEELYSVFTEVEMPSAVTLCRMELNGFGFSLEESENQKGIMIAKLSALEEQAYTLAGHPFSLSATEDVAQVLFVELLLPPSGDPTAGPVTRSLAPGMKGGARKGRQKNQFSTSKDVLEKLKKLHPLPGVILEWRQITNALTKVVFPLQKEKVLCDRLSMYRIYSDCQLHTATGRVSLSEPNLQNVPKDFEIIMPDLIGESPPPNSVVPNSRKSRGGSSKLKQMIGPRQVAMVTDDNSGTKFSVSMRHAFIPFAGGILLAADYSQLELRMIAYLSDDRKLIQVLNEDGDVFKLITAQWKNIKPEEVTPEERAQAKQVCYGMIYGIGARALGEQLEVEENDAAVFIETFKARYPGMRSYLRKTVDTCREKGYVQTMLGRKRYLPQITAANPHAQAQAERQAVNTTVQGSAADLVKMATNKIDERLAQMFPMTVYPHRQKLNSKVSSTLTTPPQGAFLVLQLHDELIYEVSQAQVMEVARIVKESMETAIKLPVKMPVKVKVGPSWGTLEDIEL